MSPGQVRAGWPRSPDPLSPLAKLYRGRWQVETHLAHLKRTLGMDVLHCHTVDGVLKELYMFALVVTRHPSVVSGPGSGGNWPVVT